MSAEKKNTSGKRLRVPHYLGMILVVVVMFGLLTDATRADNDNFYADIIRLDNVATKIHQNYFEDLDSEKLVDSAIEGMMNILDPHTSFFKRKQYEELRVHTEGKFGGLGIQIAIREKVITVMTPISGTPASRAGIQSGDQIIEIEDKSTRGITLEQAVAKLRGEPGTDVKITVRRRGENKELDFTITREIISIPAVPFAGILDNGVGYVKLTSFSEDAGVEVEKAIEELLDKGMKSLIFDLRQNPGGLLPQAREVSAKFLEKNSLVVSTRGRVRGQNKEFKADGVPIIPKDMPLAILVNSASASASEIVAGAVQDWDRGLVIGDTTFGKGSVQSILPLDKDHHLKLTTALYYTPSGRCINRPENGGHAEEEEEQQDIFGDDLDTTAEADTSEAPEDTTTYRTKGGRIVYGGGGIIPDKVIEPVYPEIPVRALLVKDAFFKFANHTYPKFQKEGLEIDTSFQVSDQMMEDFYAYLDTIDFEFTSISASKFKEFKERAGLIDSLLDTTDTDADETLPIWTEEERSQMKALAGKIDSLLVEEGKREFEESDQSIRDHIREAFLIRELGQDHQILFRNRLEDDNIVKETISLLTNKEEYEKLLTPSEK